MIRLSVGTEHIEDLKLDFEQSFQALEWRVASRVGVKKMQRPMMKRLVSAPAMGTPKLERRFSQAVAVS